MKKFLFLLLAFVSLTVLFTACGSNSVANETQIRSDLEAYSKAEFLAENEKIVNMTLEKRETEKDKDLDVVWCTVTTEDDRCSYEKGLVLTYNYYDEGGWILDLVSVNNKSEWVITPLTGASNDEISASLNGINITADNEIWYVSQDNIKNISIDNQETNLDAKTDTVMVSLTVDDLVEEAIGQLKIQYTFNDGWVVDSISGTESFTANFKPGLELNITDETLLNELSGETFEYGITEETIFWTSNDLQTISINKSDLSGFEVESHDSFNKGTVQKYVCSCVLTKPHAEFALNIGIAYSYIDGWNMEPISIEAKCTTATIEGMWKGTYRDVPYNGTCELTITGVDADGTINAIYSYNPEVTNDFSEAGSYHVSGTIDLSTLLITLEAGEWIEQPKWDTLMKSDIIVRLYVDDSTLSGSAQHGNSIIVTQ